MRALWIEDHQLIADSLELLLQLVLPELSLDKAQRLEQALPLAASIPYELILLDWWLHDEEGGQAIEALRKAGCNAPVVVVSGDEREPVLRRAQQLGVAGFVRKSAPPQELVDTVRAVLEGRQTTLPPPRPSRAGLPPLDLDALYPQLTPRQHEVFRLLLRGAADKQIARELGIGDSTVKTHVRVILQSLGVQSRGEAAHKAREAGSW